ncbi:MAG: hypothetical protein U0V72_00695 [Cytophagales bacterium]
MAYPNSAIPVTNPVGVTAETDTYPTHLAQLGKGGHRSVASIAERDAIPKERREFGMTVTVISGSNVETYMLKNIALGGADNDLSNNNNWKINFEIANTGDYYVHSSTGVDKAGNGSVIAPFKTIQYAISQLNSKNIYDANIKVLGGTYDFFDNEYLRYRGTITCEENVIINVKKTTGYLIEIDDDEYPYGVNIVGKASVNFAWLVGNTFTKSSQGVGLLKSNCSSTIVNINLEFKEVVTAYNPYNINAGVCPGIIALYKRCVLNLKNTSYLFSRLTGNDTANIAQQPLFDNSYLYGSNVGIDACNFSETTIDLTNYNANGGSFIKNCNFAGNTRNFRGQSYYLAIGNPADPNRLLSIINCSFDIVSLNNYSSNVDPKTCVVKFLANDVKISFSRNRMQRAPYYGTNYYPVYCVDNGASGCTVALFNNIGVVPFQKGAESGGTTYDVTEVNSNQYIYDNSGQAFSY